MSDLNSGLSDNESDLSDENLEEIGLTGSVSTVKERETRRKRRNLYGADVDDIYGGEDGRDVGEFGLGGKKKRRHKKDQLSDELARKMGQANQYYVDRKNDEAIELCREVIRLGGTVASPYQLLGLIYEEMGEMEQALSVNMVTAHLVKTDSDLWVRNADMASRVKDYNSAVFCYSKAIKLDPNDLDSIYARAMVHGKMGDNKKAIDGLQHILTMKRGHPLISKTLAEFYNDRGESENAIHVMEEALCIAQEDASSYDPNTVAYLCDLYMEANRHTDALKLLGKVVNPNAPSAPLELLVKKAQCIALTSTVEDAEPLFKKLFAANIAHYADLYLEVAEVYAVCGEPHKAVDIYQRVLQCPGFDGPDTWHKMANCFKELGDVTNAVYYLQKVYASKPGDVDSALDLCDLYKDMGQVEEALQIVTSGRVAMEDNQRVSLKAASLLFKAGKFSEFTALAGPIVSSLLKSDKQKRKRDAKGDEAATDIPADDVYELVVGMCKSFLAMCQYEEASELVNKALQWRKSEDKYKKLHQELKLLAVDVAIQTGNYSVAFETVRDVCSKRPYSTPMWNLFNTIANQSGLFTRNQKLVTRLREKYPTSVPLKLLAGHHCSVGGNYVAAISEYLEVQQHCPDHAMIYLCVGVCYLHMVMRKSMSNRTQIFLNMLAQLGKYQEVRTSNHQHFPATASDDLKRHWEMRYQLEAWYNVARSYHQLCLYPFAIHFYKLVLDGASEDSGCSSDCDRWDCPRSIASEAAFNLSLIYRASGEQYRASQLLLEHVQV